MPEIPGHIPLECGDCGAHFQVDPAGSVADSACSECGGTRFFRSQPSPTQSDGTLRNMVDSDSQKDQGGNPLGEGSIMGNDGERGRGFRDNYMHSKVSEIQGHQTRNGPTTVAKRIEMRNLNMEPYAPLWDTSYVRDSIREAGAALPMLGEAVMKVLPFALPTLMRGALGSGGQQAGGMAPEAPDPAPSMNMLGSADIPFVLLADLETPHSVKSVDEQHDDPEQQDQKEFNDGDRNPSNQKNPNNEDSGADGEDGVRDATSGYGIGPNSPSLQRAMMILPLLMHYFNSDESGEGDPLIKSLHDALEQESPGYLDNEHPEGHKFVQMIIKDHNAPHQVHAGANMFPQAEMPNGQQNSSGGVCASCGSPLMSDGTCPNCGGKNTQWGAEMPTASGGGTNGYAPIGGGGPSYPPDVNRTANRQGPVTPEQFEAIREYLDSHGQQQLMSDVIAHPEDYGWLLDQIKQQPNTPQLVDPNQAQQNTPPMGMMSPPGAMPVMDPSQAGGGGGMPMQPMSHKGAYPMHPEDMSNIPGAPHPIVPDPQRPDKALALQHLNYDDPTGWYHDGMQTPDQITPNELLLDSDPNLRNVRRDDVPAPGLWDQQQPTPYVQDTGQWGPKHQGRTADANNVIPRCPNCNSATTTVVDGIDDETQRKGRCHACDTVFNLAEKKSMLISFPNPRLAMPQTSLQWHDSNSEPLIEGRTYALSSPEFDEPDMVRVVASKPDAISLELVGDFANIHSAKGEPDFVFTPQQVANKKLTFVPANEFDSERPDPNQPIDGMPGLDQVPQSGQTTDEASSSYPNRGTVSSVVTSEEVEPELYDDLCHKCGCDWVTHTASSPTQTMHECNRCSTAWETQDNWNGREANIDLSWLNESPDDEGFFSQMERARSMREYGTQSRSLASVAAKDERLQVVREVLDHNKHERTAGRHFTPGEQKQLINEKGKARNTDLLDLANTHYEASLLPPTANGLNAPDEHLVFGL